MYKHTFVIAAVSSLASLALLAASVSAEKPASDGAATVNGAMDKDIIRRVIRRHIGDVKRCYETELEKNKSLAGRVLVRFTIDTEGKVSESSIQESSLNSAPAEKCIADVMRAWEFPKPRGGKVIVTYPFVLATTEPDPTSAAK